jgi:hypothetical protein
MEITRKLSDLDPPDRALVERLFGRTVSTDDSVVILREQSSARDAVGLDANVTGISLPPNGDQELPAWCNVLEGFSEAELAEFDALVEAPVRLTVGLAPDGSHTP